MKHFLLRKFCNNEPFFCRNMNYYCTCMNSYIPIPFAPKISFPLDLYAKYNSHQNTGINKREIPEASH